MVSYSKRVKESSVICNHLKHTILTTTYPLKSVISPFNSYFYQVKSCLTSVYGSDCQIFAPYILMVTYDYLWWFSGTGFQRLLFTRLLYFFYFSVRHAASRYISLIVSVVQFFVFSMFIQSVFKRVNRWCIYNIFWHFIPVFCYSNTEGVFSDVSVCSIIYHFLAIGSCTKSLLCVIY